MDPGLKIAGVTTRRLFLRVIFDLFLLSFSLLFLGVMRGAMPPHSSVMNFAIHYNYGV